MEPRFSLTALKMSYAPQTMQGVVVHTCTWYVPVGSLGSVRREQSDRARYYRLNMV